MKYLPIFTLLVMALIQPSQATDDCICLNTLGCSVAPANSKCLWSD